MANKNLQKAKDAKKDEFYTQLKDIEKELKNYRDQFKDKIIFCNCDDPYESNFFKYFAMNFNYLGLKKLITTCYAGSPIVSEQLSLFDVKGLILTKQDSKKPYKIEITEVNDYNNDGAVDLSDVEYLLKNKKNTLSLLNGDGDFRSKECVELLKEADIVVTNPPFSLYREYVAQLIKFNKQFLIIGNFGSITYKEIFPLFQQNKMWTGYSPRSMNFKMPNGEMKAVNAKWFTNLEVSKRHEQIILYKEYDETEYPKYVNYDAIEVSKVSEIPVNYDGAMGVPVTFIEKYNPDQFELVGSSLYLAENMRNFAEPGEYMPGGPKFYLSKPNKNFKYTRLYERIVIKLREKNNGN